jgi:hypothetical protein
VVLDVLGSCSFLATPERHLEDLAPWSFYNFLAIPRLTMVLEDSVAFFLRTMVYSGFCRFL